MGFDTFMRDGRQGCAPTVCAAACARGHTLRALDRWGRMLARGGLAKAVSQGGPGGAPRDQASRGWFGVSFGS